MGIKVTKQFDSTKDRNFKMWLKRTKFYLEVTKCFEKDKTNPLTLLLDKDSFKTPYYLRIHVKTKFSVAIQQHIILLSLGQKKNLLKYMIYGAKNMANLLNRLHMILSLLLTELI